MSEPILPQNTKSVTLLQRVSHAIGSLFQDKATLRQDVLRAKAHGLVASDRAARREGGAV